MNSFKELAIWRKETLVRLIETAKERIKKAPEGTIQIKTKDKHVYCYLTNRDADDRRNGSKRVNKIYLRKTSKEDWLLATAIAQRGYDEEVQKRAEKELKIIEKLITLYEQGTVEEVYGLLSWQRQRLITPIRLTDEQYAEQWQAQEYRRKKPADDAVLLETARGELVNSKSEVFIADRLKDRRRPYFYEFPVELVDHLTGKPYTAYPDFYVLNSRTRKSYYWEHFGRGIPP